MNKSNMDIPSVRNSESMFSCGLLTSYSCEHNKQSIFNTGPCHNCKAMNLYSTSPRNDSFFTPSSSYGSSPGKGFTMSQSNELRKHKDTRQVKWTSTEPEIIPTSLAEGSEVKMAEQTSKPKSILKQKEQCMIIVHSE